eukprot:TRINITY_DN2100_c0_g1_i1.p1 TRINITY_DN2100_c0_g1~~TRINITY_DN2100_c0_g1_i1.p1  ORF type:complete len:451 (+),score=91.35 TRINITY_DN2100_c0_g1_i1:49-1353(+)
MEYLMTLGNSDPESMRKVRQQSEKLFQEASVYSSTLISELQQSYLDQQTKLTDMYITLDKKMKKLNNDIQFAEENQQKLDLAYNQKQSGIIKIKVGDELFTTSRYTLTQGEHMLSAMFRGNFSNEPDQDGVYHIDWPYGNFTEVLNFLRTGQLTYSLDVLTDREDILNLLETAEYFAIEDMVDTIVEQLKNMDIGDKQNLLKHVNCGGTLTVKEFTFTGGVSAYNANTLSGGITSSWQNNGCFIDEGFDDEDHSVSSRTNRNQGSTFRNAQQEDSTGIIIADITGNVEKAKIALLMVFNMLDSDGMTSHVRFLMHESSSNDFPNAQDPGWEELIPWQEIAISNAVTETPYHAAQVAETYELDEPIYTRYLRIEVKNDGRYGQESYIELRQVKAFSRLPGDDNALQEFLYGSGEEIGREELRSSRKKSANKCLVM